MSTEQSVEVVRSRAEAAGVRVQPEVLSACADYIDLLAQWNRRINLTSLPLSSPLEAQTVDRLVIEPLLAAAFLGADAVWADLGSGGGSPALPIKIARPASTLTMVESKERKCAFLREAVRSLRLARATVIQGRIEDADLRGLNAVTVRAVKLDASIAAAIAGMLAPGGRLLAFGSAHGWADFAHERRIHLPGPEPSDLHVLRKL